MIKPNVRRAFRDQMGKKQNYTMTYPAILGDKNRVVDVPNRPGYVYVQVGDVTMQAFCAASITRAAGSSVMVGYDFPQLDLFQVLGVRSGAAFAGLSAFQNGQHAAQHQWLGSDVVYTHIRQFLPLRPYISGAFQISIYPAWGYFGGELIGVSAQSINLEEYIPIGDGYAKMVLLTLNASGVLTATPGDDVVLAELDSTTVPVPPTGTIFIIGAVRLFFGQQTINEAVMGTDLLDLRYPHYHTHGTTEIAGGQVADHDHSGDTGDGDTFDAANLTSGASGDGDILTADGAGGAAWETPTLASLSDVDLSTPPTDGQALIFVEESGLWIPGTGGGGAGGAPTTAEYITTASSGDLSAEVVIPGLAASADIAGAAGAGICHEFDGGADPFTWTSTPSTHTVDTDIKSHLHLASTDGTEYIGYEAWSPAGAFDIRMKFSLGNGGANGSVGIFALNSDNSMRTLIQMYGDDSNKRSTCELSTYNGSYSVIGSVNKYVYSGYLRLTRGSSNDFKAYFSQDGIMWELINSASFTITVARLGIRFSDAAHEAAIDWLRTDV